MEHFAQTISPSVHLEEQTVIASAIIPMKHFQACEEICSCQSGVEQEAGGVGGRYPSAWVKTVTNSSFSVTSGLHFSKCIRSSVYSMHAEDLHIKITWVVSHSEHTHTDILTFLKNASSYKALNGFLLNLSLLMRHLWNVLFSNSSTSALNGRIKRYGIYCNGSRALYTSSSGGNAGCKCRLLTCVANTGV